MRRAALDECGGWDPFNVTEDADLSFRLALSNQPARFGWLREPTYEEAVPTIRAWIGQRTRWIKGFAQTWIGHVQAPMAPGGRAGCVRALSLQITLGLTLLSTLLHLPTVIMLTVLALSGEAPSWLIGALGGGFYVSGLGVSLMGARRAGHAVRIGDLLTLPLYWALMSIPAWLAMWELIVRPTYWNKTTHGVSARIPCLPTPPHDDPAPCPIPPPSLQTLPSH